MDSTALAMDERATATVTHSRLDVKNTSEEAMSGDVDGAFGQSPEAVKGRSAFAEEVITCEEGM